MVTAVMQAASSSGQKIELRTSVWYDGSCVLDFPAEWSLTVHWPGTPPPLSEDQIAESIERPAGQPPVKELCRGKSRPLIIVDDLNRPTPAHRVVPYLLRQFEQAGIRPQAVRILVATGTHAPPDRDSVLKKVGAAASECEILIHHRDAHCVKAGRTSRGTPVFVNQAVVSSDFLVGIGGVFPNYTAGFGGGSKLALGVLAFRSIRHLHYRYPSMGWGALQQGHELRRDLDEIAQMINLRSAIFMHIDAQREVIRLTCGDPVSTYDQEAEFTRTVFRVPPPGDADAVISNAYPSDLSVTSVHQKGLTPLLRCAPQASRIVVASCPEGFGHHGLFPLGGPSKFHRLQHIARRVAITPPRELLRKMTRRRHAVPAVRRNPIWLYRPGQQRTELAPQSAEFHISDSWPRMLEVIRREHPDKTDLKVVVYPCAPMQVIE